MNKLAYWRGKRGLTVRELAEKSGLTPKAISRIEKGHNRAYVSTLGKLAAALDIDLNELAELVEDGKTSEPDNKLALAAGV